MFVVLLHYLKPLTEVERLIPAHRQFLERHYASGCFVLSGPKAPRTGGVILAQAESRRALEAVLAQDPFHRERIAEYDIIEFHPTMSAAGWREFITS